MRVADPEATPDGRPQGHDGRASRLFEATGQDGVVVGIGQDHEALVAQLFGGVEQFHGIGEQGVLVPDHLELHPVRVERLAGELGGEDGFGGGEAAGRVGQHPHAVGAQHVEDPPCAAGSRRRTDTVASDEPEASTTASRTSGLEIPPVPRTSRDPRTWPAMTKSVRGWSTSAPRCRGHDLDHVVS